MPSPDISTEDSHDLERLRKTGEPLLQNSVESVDALEDRQHEGSIRRREREDVYGVDQAITRGIRSVVKMLSFCFPLGILLGFILGCWLTVVYILGVVESSEQTRTLLGKALEWSGVLFTCLFFENFWRGRKRD